MAVYEALIANTTGEPVAITGTTSGGANTIYTVGADLEEVFVYFWSIDDTNEIVARLMIDNTEMIVYLPPYSGIVCMLPGHRLKNIVLKAYTDTTTKLIAMVDANKIT